MGRQKERLPMPTTTTMAPRCGLVLLGLAAVGVGCGRSRPPYSDASGGYAVEFPLPGAPQDRSADGRHSMELGDERGSYRVTWSLAPVEATTMSSRDLAAYERAFESKVFVVDAQADATLGGIPAQDFTGHGSFQGVPMWTRTRIALKGDRFYMVSVSAAGDSHGDEARAAATRYFQSFRFVEAGR
jgi:hypothetical protein